MPDPLKISMIQSGIKWKDIESNLMHFESLFKEVSGNTDVVLLPEMFSTGFTMDIKGLAEGMGGKTIEWMRRNSSKYNFVISGSIVFSENSNTYNRLIWMTPSGSVSYYDKRHLFRMGHENEHFTKGKERLIVNHKGWKICPLICYDLRFPVWSRNTEGYDVLIYVANWPAARSYAWSALLRARAIENQCYVAGLNRVGTDGEGTAHSGESALLDPLGYPMHEIIKDRETVITVSLDYNILTEYRRKFPVGDDADRFTVI